MQTTPKQPNTNRPSLRSACLGAERSDGLRLRISPSECAEEHRVWAGQLHRRVQLHRELTHRVCLNGAPLARSEFRGAAHTRAPQVARSEAKGRSQQGDLLLGTFLRPAIRGRQEKYLARRGETRPTKSSSAAGICISKSCTRPAACNAQRKLKTASDLKGLNEHHKPHPNSTQTSANTCATDPHH